jgi:adenylate kinase family enzyme
MPPSPPIGPSHAVRVIVTGRRGTGKTTFARCLADRLGVQPVALDRAATGRARPEEARHAALARRCPPDGRWIAVGNHGLDRLAPSATLIIILSPPWYVRTWRFTRRELRRFRKRWRLRRLRILALGLLPGRSAGRRYRELEERFGPQRVVRVRTDAEAAALIEGLRGEPRAAPEQDAPTARA